jgi:hypothetical protein
MERRLGIDVGVVSARVEKREAGIECR